MNALHSDNVTSASLSTQIEIQVLMTSGEYRIVGAIKSFESKQVRDIQIRLEEDESGKLVTKLIPASNTITLHVTRTVLDGSSITEAFGGTFRSLSEQKEPFMIQVVDIQYGTRIITIYHNCWFYSLSTPINADDYLIIDKAVIWCEKMTTIRTNMQSH